MIRYFGNYNYLNFVGIFLEHSRTKPIALYPLSIHTNSHHQAHPYSRVLYTHTHTTARSRTRKPQPHYPKYSSAHSGHMQFSSGFCQLDVGERKRRRRAVGNARGRSSREVGGGRSVILPWLPVISRFYSGRLARRSSFSWKMSYPFPSSLLHPLSRLSRVPALKTC